MLPSSQKNIDSTLTPNSFLVTDKQLKITEVMFKEEKILNNVAGYIEGSDRVMKNEIVVFSGHYDHIGVNGTKVNPGADDDASGCAALLSTAEAFKKLELVTRTVYEIGFTVANKKTRLVVDNPFSSWGKSK